MKYFQVRKSIALTSTYLRATARGETHFLGETNFGCRISAKSLKSIVFMSFEADNYHIYQEQEILDIFTES